MYSHSLELLWNYWGYQSPMLNDQGSGLQRYSQSRRTACRRTEGGLEVILYGSSPLTFFRSAGNGR